MPVDPPSESLPWSVPPTQPDSAWPRSLPSLSVRESARFATPTASCWLHRPASPPPESS